MGFLAIIFRLVSIGLFCVLILILVNQKSKMSALKEEIGSKNVEISILNKKNEELSQANAALEKRQPEGGAHQQIADVEAWAEATRAQMQSYIDEVNQYASTLVANAQAEANKIMADASSHLPPEA